MLEPFKFTNATINHPDYTSTIKEGVLHFGYYENGEVAIQVFDLYEGPYSTATVNLEAYGLHPEDGNVFISDYGETQGMTEFLVGLGIVSEPVKTVYFGPYDAKANECRLITDLL